MTKKSYNLTHNPYGKLKEDKSLSLLEVMKSTKESFRKRCVELEKKNELLEANNSDRKKLIDEILTAIQDQEIITWDMLNDWGQEEYGIEHRIGAEG